jgi:hypothetical protein
MWPFGYLVLVLAGLWVLALLMRAAARKGLFDHAYPGIPLVLFMLWTGGPLLAFVIRMTAYLVG